MLIREGDERTGEIDHKLAALLAAVAGALNAAAFHAVGFFSANMTGNVSALSDMLMRGYFFNAFFFLSIVLCFILGATLSGLLVSAGRRRGMASVYAYSILLEAILLMLMGLGDIFLVLPGRVTIIVLGLSFLMGLQNAVATRISNARVRTTHISGIATDIGIELALLIDSGRGAKNAQDPREVGRRLGLHATTILSFLGGGLFGVGFYQAFGSWLYLAMAVALLTVAVPAILKTRAGTRIE